MGRALLLGVLLLAGLLALVFWRVLPGQRTHALTSTSFRQLEASGVGRGAIDRLLPLQDREFVDPSELVAAAEALLEPAEVERIGERLRRSIRTRPCGPNRSARRVHRIQSSRDHPLYDRLRAHTLVPQAELPAVPTQLVFLPGDRGAFVLGKLGELAHFDAALHATSALHIPGVYQGGGDQGAVAVLPAPDFPESCHLYVAFVSEAGDRNVVQRLCWEGDAEAAAESLVDVLRFPKDDALEVHGIGGLHFTGDGTLLVAVGDPSQDHAQRPFDLEGKLLAVPPEHLKPGFFVISHGARFATLRSFLSWPRPTIVASGLRAPFSLTPWRGMLLIGDVGDDGWGSHEEIQLYSAPGANYGWPECRDPDLHADYDPPLLAYRRGDPAPGLDDPAQPRTTARAVVVGAVYDGARDRYGGLLTDRLIYTDYAMGFVRGARLQSDGAVQDDVFLTHVDYVTDLAVGPDGYLYGVSAAGDGGLFRLELR